MFSLNIPLPIVDITGDEPYVLASRIKDGLYAVATLPRSTSAKGSFYPRASVTIQIANSRFKIGAFGIYDVLNLELPEKSHIKKLYIIDILSEEGRDITSDITIQANKITIPGQIFDDLCDYTGDYKDTPGFIIFSES